MGDNDFERMDETIKSDHQFSIECHEILELFISKFMRGSPHSLCTFVLHFELPCNVMFCLKTDSSANKCIEAEKWNSDMLKGII